MIAAIWNGSLHESVLVNEKQRGSSPESPVIFTMIIEKVQFRSHENGVEAERHCIDCDLLCGRWWCCGSDGDKGYCKVGREKVGLTVGAQKTLWTSYLKMVDKSIIVDGPVVLREEVLECGIEGESGWKCKTWDRAQLINSSQQVFGEVETCSEIFMASPNVAFEHRENYNLAGFFFERFDDGRRPKRQNCQLELRKWWRT